MDCVEGAPRILGNGKTLNRLEAIRQLRCRDDAANIGRAAQGTLHVALVINKGEHAGKRLGKKTEIAKASVSEDFETAGKGDLRETALRSVFSQTRSTPQQAGLITPSCVSQIA